MEVIFGWILLGAIQILDARLCVLPRLWYAEQRRLSKRNNARALAGWTVTRDVFFASGHALIGYAAPGGFQNPFVATCCGLIVWPVAFRLGRALSRLGEEARTNPQLDPEVSDDGKSITG